MRNGRVYQVRNHGTEEVGGDYFDQAIREGVIARYFNKHGGEDRAIHPDAKLRLLYDCEQLKIKLSLRESATIYRNGFFCNDETPFTYTLTREELEEITLPLVRSGIARVANLLENAGIGPAQVSLCLVTGGMSQIPAIVSRLHEMFGPHRVEVSPRSGTLIAQGAAWIAHDQQRLELAKPVELQIARGSYLPLVDAGTPIPVERETKSASFHLYCVDPRDSIAKFALCTPHGLHSDLQASDARIALGNMVINVDRHALPFRERLELNLDLDSDMVLHAHAYSTNLRSGAKRQYHDLTFAIPLPQASNASQAGDGEPPPDEAKPQHERGDLVIRSNVAQKVNGKEDDFLVPGDLLYTYKRTYFDSRLRPPQVQVEERLYYEPCAVCGRASNHRDCHCGSNSLSRKR